MKKGLHNFLGGVIASAPILIIVILARDNLLEFLRVVAIPFGIVLIVSLWLIIVLTWEYK